MAFDHVNIAVSELERSRAFYEEMIGLRLLELKKAPDGVIAYAVMGDETGAVKLELALAPGGRVDEVKPWSMHLAFTYPEYQAVYEKHRDAGCIKMDEHEKGKHFISDPDGYSIEIMKA